MLARLIFSLGSFNKWYEEEIRETMLPNWGPDGERKQKERKYLKKE
jgi:hypothetical protein